MNFYFLQRALNTITKKGVFLAHEKRPALTPTYTGQGNGQMRSACIPTPPTQRTHSLSPEKKRAYLVGKTQEEYTVGGCADDACRELVHGHSNHKCVGASSRKQIQHPHPRNYRPRKGLPSCQGDFLPSKGRLSRGLNDPSPRALPFAVPAALGWVPPI